VGDEQPPPAAVTEERRKEHDTAITIAARYPTAAASPRTTRWHCQQRHVLAAAFA